MKAMEKADDTITVGQLKAACEDELAGAELVAEPEATVAEVKETALEKRIREEDSSISNLWTIMPHRQNYILLGN